MYLACSDEMSGLHVALCRHACWWSSAAGLYLTGGGVRGFNTPQEVADFPESSAESLWGSTLTPPPKNTQFQYIYVQLYAAYASIETDVI